MIRSIINNLLLVFLVCFLFNCSKPDLSIRQEQGVGPMPDGDYYVATWGDDSNPGTFDSPWASWQKAFETAEAGNTVYFRGGIYRPVSDAYGNSTSRITPRTGKGHNGTDGNPIRYFNYPGETPILDYSLFTPSGNFNTGLLIEGGNLLHFKGLTIRNVWQRRDGVTANGIQAYACNNLTFENFTVHNIGGRAFGFIAGFGSVYPEIKYDTTRFINCDAYNICDSLCNDLANCETTQPGGISDGFKCDNTAGSYILFEECRAWNFSDNGIDISGSVFAEVKNCWLIGGGLLFNGVKLGEGGGIKYGDLREPITTITRRIVNCISAYNTWLGFDENNSGGGYYPLNCEIYNNVSYKNYIGFGNFSYMEGATYQNKYRNNVSYKETRYARGDEAGDIIEDHNSWLSTSSLAEPAIPLTDEDFVSTNPHELTKPRQADGSLPKINFLRLSKDSKLIDAGIDVGLPFNGNAPDLGTFESDW